MQSFHPSVIIRKNSSNNKQSVDLDFATLLIYFHEQKYEHDTNIDNHKPLSITSYHDIKNIPNIANNITLHNTIKIYFENGGKSLYYLEYPYHDKSFESLKLEQFVKRSCDNLMNLEVIVTQNLINLDARISENRLNAMQTLSFYAQTSDRLFITDINEDMISNHLDRIEESAIYYPWFVYDKSIIAPSIVASALHSSLAHNFHFSHSIANKKIESLSVQTEELSKKRMEILEQEGINTIVLIPSKGLRIWGVKMFNSRFNSVNELRVMKHIKRGLKSLSRRYLFEPNSGSLHDRLFLKINNFLFELWENGALSGTTKDEAYLLESHYDKANVNSQNRLDFTLHIAISRPLEYITIKLNRISDSDDTLPAKISVES
jgi:hypothetical protein